MTDFVPSQLGQIDNWSIVAAGVLRIAGDLTVTAEGTNAGLTTGSYTTDRVTQANFNADVGATSYNPGGSVLTNLGIFALGSPAP